MVSRRFWGMLFGAVLLVPTAWAQEAPPRTVSVSGEGRVTVAPDRATVRFGIVSRAETAEAARSQNAEAAGEAMNAVRALGIPEEKIRMETLRLQPHRERDPQTDTIRERGYEAHRQVVVETDSLDLLPRLVTRVVQRGANRLDGIDYGLRDRTGPRNDALRQAATRARDKARLLATTLDAELGPVRQIQEQSFGFDDPSPRVRMQMAKSVQEAAPVPDAFAAGEIEVSATVQVIFDLQ